MRNGEGGAGLKYNSCHERSFRSVGEPQRHIILVFSAIAFILMYLAIWAKFLKRVVRPW